MTSLYEGRDRNTAVSRIHMSQQAASLEPATPCFVLSLDGGGAEGFYALGVLKETMSLFVGIVHGLETVWIETNRPVPRLCHFLVTG
jgi:hypothetical protein